MEQFYIILSMIIVGLFGGMIGFIVANVQQRRLEASRLEEVTEKPKELEDQHQQQDYFSQF